MQSKSMRVDLRRRRNNGISSDVGRGVGAVLAAIGIRTFEGVTAASFTGDTSNEVSLPFLSRLDAFWCGTMDCGLGREREVGGTRESRGILDRLTFSGQENVEWWHSQLF